MEDGPIVSYVAGIMWPYFTQIRVLRPEVEYKTDTAKYIATHTLTKLHSHVSKHSNNEGQSIICTLLRISSCGGARGLVICALRAVTYQHSLRRCLLRLVVDQGCLCRRLPIVLDPIGYSRASNDGRNPNKPSTCNHASRMASPTCEARTCREVLTVVRKQSVCLPWSSVAVLVVETKAACSALRSPSCCTTQRSCPRGFESTSGPSDDRG